jgi:valyl-tRNA synthetase
VELLSAVSAAARPAGVVASSLGAAWYTADDEGPQAAARREAQAEHLRRGIERLRALLANPSFSSRAPGTVVERERARLAELEAQLRHLDS